MWKGNQRPSELSIPPHHIVEKPSGRIPFSPLSFPFDITSWFWPKTSLKKKKNTKKSSCKNKFIGTLFIPRQFSLERVAYMLGPQAWSVQSFPVAKALSLSRGRFSPFDMSFASFALGTSNLAEFGMGRLGKTNGGSFLWETWHVNKKTELTTYEECLTSANGTQSYQSARRQSWRSSF